MHRSWCFFVGLCVAVTATTGLLAQDCSPAAVEMELGLPSITGAVDVLDDVSIDDVAMSFPISQEFLGLFSIFFFIVVRPL